MRAQVRRHCRGEVSPAGEAREGSNAQAARCEAYAQKRFQPPPHVHQHAQTLADLFIHMIRYDFMHASPYLSSP